MSALRVALCADFPEERWPSMDRVAKELVTHLRRSHAHEVDLTPVCPPFTRRATRLVRSGSAFSVDRALNRWWDYPRHVGSIASGYDVFHIVDHSYAQLVHHLPADRTVVTCHDLDTFRSVLRPADEPRSALFRKATRRILTGLQQAAWITCDSTAVRDELLGFSVVSPERVSVVPVGVGERFSACADATADCAAARLVASKPGAIELLHVGSTIARKRIDALLAICAALVPRMPDLHLVRVGEPFTLRQQQMIHELGLADRISVVGFLDERTLAAMYRRAALVLQPSEREGFGLPVLEALACGTPVIASDLPVLREVGGAAVEDRRVADTDAWVGVVTALIDERREDPVRWSARQAAGRARARCFSWAQFASRLADTYAAVATTSLKSQLSAWPMEDFKLETSDFRLQVSQLRVGTRTTVLHAAKLYPPAGGGMETVLRDLCDGTAEDWNVRVVAANDWNETVRERCGEVDVVRVAALGQAVSVPLCPSFPFELWRRRADCVVLHEPNPIAGTALFLRTPAPRLVIWHHSDLVRPWWAPLTYGRIVQHALYRRADCVIVSSPALAAGSALVAHARRVAVIPFGVTLERYQHVDAASQSRAARVMAAVPGPRMLFVGRLVDHKGLEVLLDAMGRCEGSLVIVGEGPLDGALRALVTEKRLGERVLFAGRVADADLPAFYKGCDVFVLPSTARTEAFGVVQIEAMAAGTPVVSTNLPTGVPWVNQDGISGLVVAPGDPAALGDALQRLLDDSALRRRLGEGARRRAETMFSRERMVATFKNLIDTVVLEPELLDERLAREAIV